MNKIVVSGFHPSGDLVMRRLPTEDILGDTVLQMLDSGYRVEVKRDIAVPKIIRHIELKCVRRPIDFQKELDDGIQL